MLGDNVPMKIGPSPDDRIEHPDHHFLRICRCFLEEVPDLCQQTLNILPRGLDQELVPVLPDVLTQKVKAFPDMHNARLLLREFQTSFP